PERRSDRRLNRITSASLNHLIVNRRRNNKRAINLVEEIEVRQQGPGNSTGCYRKQPHSLPALGRVIFAPAPEHLKILFVEFYPESNPTLMQEIEKLDTRETEHVRCFTSRDSLLSVELERRLLLNRAEEFRCR